MVKSDILVERVLKTVRRYRMLHRQDKVLLAVSGGADSVFLLYSLILLKRKLGVAAISVCNLDHCIRGKESSDDSAFVRRIAKENGLEFFYKKLNLKRASRNGLSVEEVARQKRYDFFKICADRSGSTVIATGHTLDDQAETMLMRIIKGASLKGLAGIAPMREESNLRIIRPLIELEKREIVDYLDLRGIPYRTDSSNFEYIYLRNVVRGEIIPFLERYNPKLRKALSSLAEHIREDLEYIIEAKNRFLNGKVRGRKHFVEIAIKDVITQPKAIQKEVLRDCLEKCGGEIKRLSFGHWKDAELLIAGKGKGFSIDLPGCIRITRTDKSIQFKKIKFRKSE